LFLAQEQEADPLAHRVLRRHTFADAYELAAVEPDRIELAAGRHEISFLVGPLAQLPTAVDRDPDVAALRQQVPQDELVEDDVAVGDHHVALQELARGEQRAQLARGLERIVVEVLNVGEVDRFLAIAAYRTDAADALTPERIGVPGHDRLAAEPQHRFG